MAPAAPQPQPVRVWTVNRVLLFISGICFFLAAIDACGAAFPDGTPMWAWGFGGFAAWVLAGAIPSVLP